MVEAKCTQSSTKCTLGAMADVYLSTTSGGQDNSISTSPTEKPQLSDSSGEERAFIIPHLALVRAHAH